MSLSSGNVKPIINPAKTNPLHGIPLKSAMGFYEIELSAKASLELDKAYEWYEVRFPDDIRAVPLYSPI